MDIEEWKDLPKKYVGTYFRFRKHGGKWEVGYCRDLQLAEYPVFNVLIKTSGIDWKSSLEYEFDFSFPEIGVINYKNSVMLCCRYPARQWKKAVCPDNFRIWSPFSDNFRYLLNNYIQSKPIPQSFSYSVKDIAEVFNNKYQDFKKAVEQLYRGKFAVAISPTLFTTLNYKGKGVMIWYKYTPTAIVNGDTVEYISEAFKQEVKDFFNRN